MRRERERRRGEEEREERERRSTMKEEEESHRQTDRQTDGRTAQRPHLEEDDVDLRVLHPVDQDGDQPGEKRVQRFKPGE